MTGGKCELFKENFKQDHQSLKWRFFKKLFERTNPTLKVNF